MATVKDTAGKPQTVDIEAQNFRAESARARPWPAVPKEHQNPALRRWRVIEVVSPNGTLSRHVYGHDVTNDTGRASSAIKAFDVKTMTATTRSGRNYQLVGAPGHARSGEHAWQRWCSINGVASAVDVTSQYFSFEKLFP